MEAVEPLAEQRIFMRDMQALYEEGSGRRLFL
jgi:hypothetical protein